MAHEQVLWRGRKICKHSVPKFEQFAVKTGAPYTVKLINGSYSTLEASAGTHSGGGAADSEGDGYSSSVVNTASNVARSCILLSYPRLWKGNWHIHILDPNCAELSSQACAQFALFGKGYDGLVGNNPDPGSRKYADQIMAQFYDRKKPPVATPPASAPRQPDIKDPTAAQIWNWDGIPAHDAASSTQTNKFWSAASHLTWIMRKVVKIESDVAAIKKKLGA